MYPVCRSRRCSVVIVTVVIVTRRGELSAVVSTSEILIRCRACPPDCAPVQHQRQLVLPGDWAASNKRRRVAGSDWRRSSKPLTPRQPMSLLGLVGKSLSSAFSSTILLSLFITEQSRHHQSTARCKTISSNPSSSSFVCQFFYWNETFKAFRLLAQPNAVIQGFVIFETGKNSVYFPSFTYSLLCTKTDWYKCMCLNEI